MSESLVNFTYEGIPELPEDPTQLGIDHPVPNSAMTFQAPTSSPPDGIPLFELVAKRRLDGTYDNVEYVSILTPGDPKSVPRQKVNAAIRNKYSAYYRLWKQGLQMSPSGTPLEMWPVMTPAQVHHLKSLNIFTVEQLDKTADSNLHQIPMGMTLRQQARDWLKQKKEADVLAQRTAENQALRDGQSMLEKQLAEMSAQMVELQAQLAAATKSDDDGDTIKGRNKGK